MPSGLVLDLVLRVARRLPRDGYARVFEPAFEDLRAECRSPRRLTFGALAILADSFRVACVAALTTPHEVRSPEPDGARFMDAIVQDVRYAARMLIKNPGFSIVAVVALALGIGANAAIFSLIYNLFLRPLPYEHADALMRLWGQSQDGRLARLGASVPKFDHLRRGQRSFVALAGDSAQAMALTGLGDEPQRVGALTVTANYFDVLGVRPFSGRTFTANEEERAQVAVVTRSFWVNRLSSDPAAVGRAIALDGQPYTIVGVVENLPAPDVGPAEVFLPLLVRLNGLTPEMMQRGVSYIRVTGRLKHGVMPEQARDEAARLGESYRADNREKADSSWREFAIPIREDLTGSVRPAITALLAAVALVLLIACSNVANLLTARFAGRRREIALRGALGAGRGRIVRLFLAESVLLSLAGAAAGIGVAHACLLVLPSIGALNLPIDGVVRVTQPVLWTTAGVALMAGLMMGMYPAVQAAKPHTREALNDGRGRSTGPSSHRVRSVLVASQVALSMILLVGAVLLVTSFLNLRRQEPGFDHAHILMASVALPPARYPDSAAQDRFRDRLIEQLQSAPAARAAAIGAGVPLTGFNTNAPFARADGATPPLNERPLGLTRSVSPGYFAALAIPIVKGRDFSARDTAASRQVIVISESTARKLFGDVDPIGREMFTGSIGGGIRCEIIGVVGDVRSVTLDQINSVEVYRPLTQRPQPFIQLLLRTQGDPLQMLGDLRRAVRAVDPELPLNQPRPLSAVADASLGQRKLLMALLGAFAALALLLATVGIYSVVAYLVGQRTNEIGIRLALGAHAGDVLRLLTWEGARPVVVGLAVGLAGVVSSGRLLGTLLYGVSPVDPATLALATITLAAVAFAACLIPARRALRIDPAIALRAN